MKDFSEKLKRFIYLESKATPGPWVYESYESALSPEIVGIVTNPDIVDPLNGKDCDVELSCALRNEAILFMKELLREIERLNLKESKLKETLLPVCEYAAEIYNRGTPDIPMPDDTIQRLNYAFKMFGG